MARTIQSKVRARTARTRRRAFSLVELLVVVAILGIILVIAGTQASKSFRRAKVDSIAQQKTLGWTASERPSSFNSVE